MDLISAVDLGPREHVAIVGAGGKTSLMFSLAGELVKAGCKVVTSTTTKIWHHQAQLAPATLFCGPNPPEPKAIKTGLDKHGHLFVGRSLMISGKVEGISPGLADFLFKDRAVDYVIIEADGAAGLPLKVPAEGEPVIPSTATVVIAMAGLEALGRPFGPDTVFRLEKFQKMSGLRPKEILTPEHLAKAFTAPEGLFKAGPKRARKVAFLNKRDLLSRESALHELAHLVLGASGLKIERVVIGSILEGTYSFIMEES